MKEINSYLQSPGYPMLAHEECRKALLKIGYDSFTIIGSKGSHSADVYFFGSNEDRFKEELLNNVLIGYKRRFYFSYSYSSFGYKNHYYNINYSFIK